MARISFQTRRLAGGDDSAGKLRYDDSLAGAYGDYDSALRADALLLAPYEFIESYFEATASQCYGEIELEWSVDLADVVPVGLPEATEVVLVYSETGEPETVNSGIVLVEGSDRFTFRHTGLPEGKWAYYGLFLRYQSDQDDYYELAASLSELAVKNYGSTLLMWDRIPRYYQAKDAELGEPVSDDNCLGFPTYGLPIGPLLKFLSVFGYEMDKVRTLQDYGMVSRDPQIAHGEVLDALAAELGTLIDTVDLGEARYRALLDSIGKFRQRKGTAAGTTYFLEAVLGSNISIDTVNREITIYSQRVNFIKDPLNTKSVVDIETSRDGFVGEENDPNAYLFVESGTPVANHKVYKVEADIGITDGDTVSFSIHDLGVESLTWARIVDATTGFIYATSDTPIYRNGVPHFDMLYDPATLGASTVVDIEFYTNNDSGLVRKHYLAEKNNSGTYFDGSMTRGGWLLGTSNSVTDFRWAGTANNSVSLYHEDYERTMQIVNEYLDDVLPIDVSSTYSIVDYDAIP